MIADFKEILTHSPKTLLQDAAGIAAIGVMMMAAHTRLADCRRTPVSPGLRRFFYEVASTKASSASMMEA